MSDEPEDDRGDFKEFLNKALGGEQAADDFFADLETNPHADAWVGFHELYLAIRSGGFTKHEALLVMAGYLYQLVSGAEG